jgi:hypothetical protein
MDWQRLSINLDRMPDARRQRRRSFIKQTVEFNEFG